MKIETMNLEINFIRNRNEIEKNNKNFGKKSDENDLYSKEHVRNTLPCWRSPQFIGGDGGDTSDYVHIT
jgi:hypothetical protein